LLSLEGKKIQNFSKEELETLLGGLKSKKHSQKALRANRPSPAVLAHPDDMGHYHESVGTQRTMTVRELARMQSFPDWFKFCSKVTTGGSRRRFEVPQYTQVGNAVPPLLGLELGKICKRIIEVSES
jgi:DNA (cytosine-5)-methyltransferase 1